MDNEFSEEYRQHIINLREINFEGYKHSIDNGLDSTITFEEFLLIRLDSQKDEYDRLLEEFVRINPSYFEEMDKECEQILDSLKSWDKIEEKFKEEYK